MKNTQQREKRRGSRPGWIRLWRLHSHYAAGLVGCMTAAFLLLYDAGSYRDRYYSQQGGFGVKQLGYFGLRWARIAAVLMSMWGRKTATFYGIGQLEFIELRWYIKAAIILSFVGLFWLIPAAVLIIYRGRTAAIFNSIGQLGYHEFCWHFKVAVLMSYWGRIDVISYDARVSKQDNGRLYVAIGGAGQVQNGQLDNQKFVERLCIKQLTYIIVCVGNFNGWSKLQRMIIEASANKIKEVYVWPWATGKRNNWYQMGIKCEYLFRGHDWKCQQLVLFVSAASHYKQTVWKHQKTNWSWAKRITKLKAGDLNSMLDVIKMFRINVCVSLGECPGQVYSLFRTSYCNPEACLGGFSSR